jgi:hypothetical protein
MEKIEQPIKILASALVPPTNAQVTKIEVAGQVAYIRENVAEGKNILELCAVEESWAKIAAVVIVEDSLKREVRKHPEFTEAWAEEVMKQA